MIRYITNDELYISETDPKEYLIERWRQLENQFEFNEPPIPFEQLKARILQKINANQLTIAWISEQAKLIVFHKHDNDDEHPDTAALLMDYLACLSLAQHELDLGNINRMWAYLAKGEFFNGKIRLWTYYEFFLRTVRTTSELSSAGGIGKLNKHSKVAKEEAVRLVESTQNKEAWQDEKTAVLGILEDLKKYCLKYDINLMPDRLHERLKQWIKNDADFKQKIAQAMQKK